MISNDKHDAKTACVCKEIISKGTYSPTSIMPLEKSVFLSDLIEIGKRKYNDFRIPCKQEGLIFPQYVKLAEYSSDIVLSNELVYLQKAVSGIIGIAISNRSILRQTISRLVQTIPHINESDIHLL